MIIKYLSIILASSMLLTHSPGVCSQIIPNKSTNINNQRIVGGVRKGSTLFHSFDKFNIRKNSSVKFVLQKKINRVIAIVEGSRKSKIRGSLTIAPSNKNVDLILLNSAGLKFGRKSKLNFRGSFIASTANKIQKYNDKSFTLNFKENNNSIDIFSENFNLIPGNTLALLGGEVNILNSKISTPGSHLKIQSLASKSKIEISSLNNDDRWLFKGDSDNIHGNIIMKNSRILASDTPLFNSKLMMTGNNFSVVNSKISLNRDYSSTMKGGINLNFRGNVNLSQKADIESQTFGIKNGNPIRIQANSLILNDADIESESASSGNSGSISFRIQKNVLLDNSRISTNTINTGSGGRIHLKSNSLTINRDSSITTSTFGSGQGGQVFVETDDFARLVGPRSALNARTDTSFGGNGGTVKVISGRIELINGGRINTSSESIISNHSGPAGEAGEIILNAKELIVFGPRSRITAFSQTNKNAGDISILSNDLVISNKGKINVNALSASAGKININTNTLFINNQARISAVTSSGKGNISIQNAEIIFLNNRSNITTNAINTASGGNININANFLVGKGDSNILARAKSGTGGAVTINSPGGILGFIENSTDSSSSNDIIVTSDNGLDGTIEFQAPVQDPAKGLYIHEERIIDSSKLIQQACSKLATLNSNDNQFSVVNRGGLQSNSDNYLSLINHSNNWITATANNTKNQQRLLAEQQNSEFHPVLEAHAWRYLPNGKISLFAETPTLGQPSNCNQTALKYQY